MHLFWYNVDLNRVLENHLDMSQYRSFKFTHALARAPGESVARGLRAGSGGDPVPDKFVREHDDYLQALTKAGLNTVVLPKMEQFPDSVFVEDAALCLDNKVVLLRPGAASRLGEAAALEPDLLEIFDAVVKLPGQGHVDGGDVLLTDSVAFIGLSERTDQEGISALTPILDAHGYTVKIVHTPVGVLHFKSDCGLLDNKTIFSTRILARSGCFEGFNVIEAPQGEEAAANLIRINDFVLVRAGFPKTRALLEQCGYKTLTVATEQAAKIDGGLSCLSLRFALPQQR